MNVRRSTSTHVANCIVAAVWTSTIVVCAPPREAAKDTPPVAIVHGVPLADTDVLRRFLAAGIGRGQSADAAFRIGRHITEQIVDEILFAKAAENAGIDVVDDDVERELSTMSEQYLPGTFDRILAVEKRSQTEMRAHLKSRLLMERYLEQKVENTPLPPTENPPRVIEKTNESYPQVLARQILVKTREEADDVWAQLRSRRIDFDTATRKYSERPVSVRSGDLGWFAKGELPSVFDVCFDLAVGNLSGVVMSDYGFHIFKVIARRDRPQAEEAADQREQELVAQRRHQTDLVKTERQKLWAEAKVVIDDHALRRVINKIPKSLDVDAASASTNARLNRAAVVVPPPVVPSPSVLSPTLAPSSSVPSPTLATSKPAHDVVKTEATPATKSPSAAAAPTTVRDDATEKRNSVIKENVAAKAKVPKTSTPKRAADGVAPKTVDDADGDPSQEPAAPAPDAETVEDFYPPPPEDEEEPPLEPRADDDTDDTSDDKNEPPASDPVSEKAP